MRIATINGVKVDIDQPGQALPLRSVMAKREPAKAGTPRTAAAKLAPCVHLGAPTGDVALIPCTTCRGNVRKKFAVHGCGVHGVCLPTFSGEAASLPMTCRKCVAGRLGYVAAEIATPDAPPRASGAVDAG